MYCDYFGRVCVPCSLEYSDVVVYNGDLGRFIKRLCANRKHCVACLWANFDLFARPMWGSSEISFRVLVIIYSSSQGFFFVRTHDIFPTLRHAPRLIHFFRGAYTC